MNSSPLFSYALPALLVGALGGYLLGKPSEKPFGVKTSSKKSSLRADFLSSSETELDYDKLARVCLTAAQRAPRTSTHGSPTAVATSPDVLKMKERLDDILSRSLDEGTWSRGAGFAAQNALRSLPPSDVADFETLLRATLDRGDMDVQPGAWIPEALN